MATWCEKLLCDDENERNKAWLEFFYNEDAVMKVLAEDRIQDILTAGHAWNGHGWTTTRAAVSLRALNNVAMVSNEVNDYRDSFLYSLALAAGVEIPALKLGDKASDAAFALYERWISLGGPGGAQGSAGPGGVQRGAGPEVREAGPAGVPGGLSGLRNSEEPSETQKEQPSDENDDDNVMVWDTPEVPLPADLLVLWNRAKTGQKKLDLKNFLDQLPVWAEVPARAAENNHRQDGKNVRDKTYKYWSQLILHLLRSQAVIHSVLKDWAGIDEENGDIVVLSQQHYQLMCELYQKMVEERKKASIPGSVIKEDNVLFQKEDLTNEQNQIKINRAGTSTFKGFGGQKGGFKPGGFRFRGGGFRTSSYSFRGKGGKGVQSYKGSFKGKGTCSANCFPKAGSAFFFKASSASFPKARSANLSKTRSVQYGCTLSFFKKQFGVVEVKCPTRDLQTHSIWSYPQWEKPPELSKSIPRKSTLEIQKANTILLDYQKVGAVKKCSGESESKTGHLVPWFIITKKEGNSEKNRLICDCREINLHFWTKRFKLENIQTIFPYMRKGMWGCKVDLKDAYFHLELENKLKRFMRLQVGETIWEFQAACFGLNILPHLFMSLMRPLERIWRNQGIQVFVYLDDILVLGSTQKQVQLHLKVVLETLQKAGFVINLKKSVLDPTQEINHLGFLLDLKTGYLRVTKEKLKSIKKELGKVVTHNFLSSRKMAAILGVVRACLPALPFLRAFTDTLVEFVNKQSEKGWDSIHQIPLELKDQLKEVKDLLSTWSGRPFQEKCQKELHSDSSTFAWGGVDINSGSFIQEFWREKASLHINVKELEAAIHTVKSLSKPGEKVLLSVDNQVTYYYLIGGGGKLPHFNKILRPFLKWCLENNVKLQVQWVPSHEMKADGLSRWSMDRGDYTLQRDLYWEIQKHFKSNITPKVDMFASPGNAKLAHFVSRWPHHQAVAIDALKCNLNQFQEVYANPPWTLIANWLHRLRDNPHLLCLMVCPYWVSAHWWPQLIKLASPKIPALVIHPFQGMFTNCQHQSMPPPKWPLVSVLLSGQYWKSNKSHLKILRITWKK